VCGDVETASNSTAGDKAVEAALVNAVRASAPEQSHVDQRQHAYA